jgi:hypothetical protein
VGVLGRRGRAVPGRADEAVQRVNLPAYPHAAAPLWRQGTAVDQALSRAEPAVVRDLRRSPQEAELSVALQGRQQSARARSRCGRAAGERQASSDEAHGARRPRERVGGMRDRVQSQRPEAREPGGTHRPERFLKSVLAHLTPGDIKRTIIKKKLPHMLRRGIPRIMQQPHGPSKPLRTPLPSSPALRDQLQAGARAPRDST